MKILHLASEYPPQKVFGLGRFVQDIAVESVRQGHEVHVVTNSMNGKDFDREDKGVHVHRVHFPPPPKPADPTTTVIQFNTQVIERAVSLVRKIGVDVINTHDWLTFLAGNALKKIFSAKHILTIHDTMVGKKFGRLENPEKLAANIEKYGCMEADKILCCSEYIKEELVKIYEAKENKIRVIPCAVEESRFAIDEDSFLKESFRSVLANVGETLVVYVGRLDEEKGLEVLLNAIPEVLDENRKIQFVLAGKGVMEESIRSWISKNRLSSQVKLPGYLRGKVLSYLYKVSDIQVVPSMYEPFGIVALEGMINQCAVVVSKTGGLAEIVEHGKDGLQCEPGDSRAMVKAILSLAQDVERRKRMARAGYEKAKSQYNWERVARLTADVYQEAVQKESQVSIQKEPPLLSVPEGKAWIAVLGKGQKEEIEKTLEGIFYHTIGEYEIIVIESHGERETVLYLADMLSQGKISRLVLNRPGTVPEPYKGYEIAQAIHILKEELFEYFCWIDAGVKVKAGWLESSLAILKKLGEKTPAVALCKSKQQDPIPQAMDLSSKGNLWVMERSFFARFGLPPIGLKKEAGIEYLHYIHKLQEMQCTLAMLEGLAE